MVMVSTKSSPRHSNPNHESNSFGYFNFPSNHNQAHHHPHNNTTIQGSGKIGNIPGHSGGGQNFNTSLNSGSFQNSNNNMNLFLPEVKVTLANDNTASENGINELSLPQNLTNSKSPTSPTFNMPHKIPTNIHTKNFDIKASDVSEISTLREFKEIRDDSEFDLLIIDARPFNQYSTSRVKGALSICVPSTLLKRSSFNLSNMLKTMTAQQQDIIETKLNSSKDLKIIFYDSNSDSEHCSFHLYQVLRKFHNDIQNYTKDIELILMNNGFTSFLHQEGVSDQDTIFDFQKMKSTNSGDSFSDFVLPSANASSSFLLSIKKNHVAPDENSNPKMNIPNFENPESLPTWMRNYLAPNSQNMITRNFVKIENSENARIESVVSQKRHSPSICSPNCLCPGCDQLNYNLLDGSEHGFKNRYPNILPYEHSRVKLIESPLLSPNIQNSHKYFPKVSPPVQSKLHLTATSATSSSNSNSSSASSSPCNHDDYFNANFINVPQINPEAHYIATQAPLPSTIDDFWKVVWHNNSEIIISLTNLSEYGMKKSDVYWENSETVKLLEEHDNYNGFSNLTVRKIKLTRKSKTRTITQLHFKDWPDHGVADMNALLQLSKIKDEVTTDKRAPVIVHCSAGCGRTGVFITVDLIISAFKSNHQGVIQQSKKHGLEKDSEEESIDIWNTEKDLIYFTVQQLRKQRISMVQSLNQFVFCYESVLEFFHQQENLTH